MTKLTAKTELLMGIKATSSTPIIRNAPKTIDLQKTVIEEIQNLQAYVSHLADYIHDPDSQSDPNYNVLKTAYDEAMNFSHADLEDIVDMRGVIHLFAFISSFSNAANKLVA